MILLNLRFDVRLSLGLIVAFSAFVGAAGCNTQSLVPTDGGGPRTGSGGSTGTGNRSGGTAAQTGTDGGAGTTGAGGAIATPGSGGAIGTRGAGGITGAAGFGRPFGGAAGHGPSVGGGAGRGLPPVDASTTPVSDAGAADCQCVVGADHVLRMSWDCYCASYGCGATTQGWCGAPGGWVSSCGYDVYLLNRDDPTIPADQWVFDAGIQVGGQLASDTPVYVCPTDPSLTAATVAAGLFPPSGCASYTCNCADNGPLSCPGSDGGGLPIF